MESDRAKRASGAYWGASGAPPFGAGERGRIKNIWGCRSMRRGIRYRALAPDVFYSASFARKTGSPDLRGERPSLPPRSSAIFVRCYGDIHIDVIAVKSRTTSTRFSAPHELASSRTAVRSAASPSAARRDSARCEVRTDRQERDLLKENCLTDPCFSLAGAAQLVHGPAALLPRPQGLQRARTRTSFFAARARLFVF